MKPLLLSLITWFFLLSVNAQENVITNGGFEAWDTVPGSLQQNPAGWFSTNKFYPSDTTHGIRKSPDAYSGNYSMELRTPLPEQGKDSVFIMVGLGECDLKPSPIYPSYNNGFDAGVPFDWNWDFQVSGYYKFQPNLGSKDTVFLVAESMASYGSSDYGIYGFAKGFTPQSDWTPFRFVAKKGTTPGLSLYVDTLLVNLYYRSDNKNAQNTGFFRIDELKVEPMGTDISELDGNDWFAVYPNPSVTGEFTIAVGGSFQYEVYNPIGKLLSSGQAVDRFQGKIASESSGLYLIKIIAEGKVTTAPLLFSR